MNESSSQIKVSTLRIPLFDSSEDLVTRGQRRLSLTSSKHSKVSSCSSKHSKSFEEIFPSDDTYITEYDDAQDCVCTKHDTDDEDEDEEEEEKEENKVNTSCSRHETFQAENKEEDGSVEPNSIRKRGRVSFGDVSCRLYERTIGLHPDVSSGPAIDFTWTYFSIEDVTVDEYEALYEGKRNRREMIMSRFERMNMLRKDCGISKVEIASHVREINTTKTRRRQTLNNLKYMNVEETLEKVSHRIKRIMFLRKSSSKEIEKLWANASVSCNESENYGTPQRLERSKSLDVKLGNTTKNSSASWRRSRSLDVRNGTSSYILSRPRKEASTIVLDSQHRKKFDL